MNIDQIGSNQTEVTLNNGDIILFSYQTPVAAIVNGEAIKTSKKWSSTTSRHINKWLAGRDAIEVDQSVLDSLGELK